MNVIYVILTYLLYIIKQAEPTFRFRKLEVMYYTSVDSSNNQEQGIVTLVNDVPVAFYDRGHEEFFIKLNLSTEVTTDMKNFVDGYKVESKSELNWQERYIRKIRQEVDFKPPLVPPSVAVYTEKPYINRNKNTIYCYVSGFYPAGINVTLLKNGKSFPGEVHSFDPAFSDSWEFKTLKYIHVVLQDTDSYSCQVHHVSLNQPRETYLEIPVYKTKTSQCNYWVQYLVVCFISVLDAILFIVILKNCLKRQISCHRECC